MSFWVIAPLVLFVLMTSSAVAWCVYAQRSCRKDWVRADWSARVNARAVDLPRRVL